MNGGGHLRKFCSDKCKTDAWAIRRTCALLARLPEDKKREILLPRNHLAELPEDKRRRILVAKNHMKPVRVGDRKQNQHENDMENQWEINMTENQPAEATNERKLYRSIRFPSFAIRNVVKFKNGFFETDNPELQSIIESNDWFGIHIEKVDTRKGAKDSYSQTRSFE